MDSSARGSAICRSQLSCFAQALLCEGCRIRTWRIGALNMLNASHRLPVCGMAIIVCLGCHNANPTVPSAPAPTTHAPALLSKPTLNYFDAEPSLLSLGQSTSLRWSVENAAEVQIE